MICQNCSKEFTPAKTNAKFCSSSCRVSHWKNSQTPVGRKTYDNFTKEELEKELINKVIEARGIINTFERLFREFDLWQDEFSKIEALLEKHEELPENASIDDILNKLM